MLQVTTLILACACAAYAGITSGTNPQLSERAPVAKLNTSQKGDDSNNDQLFLPLSWNVANVSSNYGNNIANAQKLADDLDSFEDRSNPTYNSLPRQSHNYLDSLKYPIMPKPRYSKYPFPYPQAPQFDNQLLYVGEPPQFPDTPQYPGMMPPKDSYVPSVNQKYHPLPYYPTMSNTFDYVDTVENYIDNQPGGTPKYYQSLQDFDQATKETTYYLHGQGQDLQNDIDPSRFTMLASVIDGMIKTMIHNSWQYYERDYNARVPGFISLAEEAPSRVISQIGCIYYEANEAISKIRNAMNNKWIDSICKIKFVNCDLIIDAYIKFGNNELKKEAELLIALGKVSRLYLENYAQSINEVARIDSYEINGFIMNAREYLQPLIEAGTEARRLIPSSKRC